MLLSWTGADAQNLLKLNMLTLLTPTPAQPAQDPEQVLKVMSLSIVRNINHLLKPKLLSPVQRCSNVSGDVQTAGAITLFLIKINSFPAIIHIFNHSPLPTKFNLLVYNFVF
jgi:hypothetical protein